MVETNNGPEEITVLFIGMVITNFISVISTTAQVPRIKSVYCQLVSALSRILEADPVLHHPASGTRGVARDGPPNDCMTSGRELKINMYL